MNNEHSAVKYNQANLSIVKDLEYPGGTIAEVQAVYKKALPTSMLPLVGSPCDAETIFKEIWNRERFDYCEHVYVLFLNGSHHVHLWNFLAEGSLNQCHVYVRKLLTLTLISHSSGFIIAHNHPSGSKEISEADKKMTRRLVEAAKLLEISCIDHLILSSLESPALSIREAYPSLFWPPSD